MNMPIFTFIDLFAGIGGMRIAFESVGGECLFSSEIDKFSRMTYEANFGESPHGDIREIKAASIPDHDVLLAGFPCQPFSLAGISKRKSLGRPHGFSDEKEGTLFFEIVRILAAKKPQAFILENVSHLRNHDKGRTFASIYGNLTKKLDYFVQAKVVDSRWVVPQSRKRLYVVGFREPNDFEFPRFQKVKLRIKDILDNNVNPKYTLSDKLWRYLQVYAARHRKRGNGFGYKVADLNGVANTLSARYHKDGAEILIPQAKGRNPRRLTPPECARLMGFPPNFRIVVSDTQAYRQFGKSVAVPVVQRIAEAMVKCLTRG